MNDGLLQSMDLMKILIHDVGICHCDLNTGMAKQLLHIDNICIIPEQIGCKRVAERVRMNTLLQTCFDGHTFTTI